MMERYKLIGREIVPCPDLLEWGRWMEYENERKIKQEDVGPLFVSTVFLGLDHQFGDKGPPLLFETMIFELHDDSYQERCSTYEQALKMHTRGVQYAKAAIAKADAALEALKLSGKIV